MEILKVTDKAFQPYGKVIQGIDVSDLLEALKETPQPDDVVYVASDEKLEACPCVEKIGYSLYGGMPIQAGYCNGNNVLLNAVEYHRDSEVNVAQTDMILILGKEQDIEEDGTYDTGKMEAFLVPAGTVIEVYATTLHYAPCNVNGQKFRAAVILPKGTNTEAPKPQNNTKEDKLLFARNKWLIAHEEAGIEGAFVGLKGENLSVE
ncbi:MAG TPA: DUF4867 family protein [Candidatus Blautia avicola]|uniref:DUF4867 family protein n=1 Tax=Candidatus Blautia avicola TaxID=2838483 RepID=A0A9D2QU37_9FIRM|nr:DUF4867 family protein [Candidatus Blautia avicola]